MSQDTRKDRRAKIVSLNVRYKSATVDEFIENHSHDVSKGGLFIKTPTPFPPGTLLKFEIRIASDKAVISGVGRVVWKREPTQAGTERPAGMGVKFIKVDESSRATIDRVVGTGAAPGGGGNFESELPDDKASIPAPPAGPGPARPPLVRRATMAGLGDGSVRPEALAAALANSSNPPPVHLSASPATPGTAAAAAALKAMPTVPRPMFPGQLQSLLHEEPVKEPTMMKQAAELLEEALREAGGSMADIGDNPLFNRPSRRPRPQSTPDASGSANAPTMPPGPGAEDALSATRTLVDASADEPPVRSLRGTTTSIGLPPPPGVSLRASSTALPSGGVTPPTPPTPRSPSVPPPLDEAAPKSTRSTRPPPVPTPVMADADAGSVASESDIAAVPSEGAPASAIAPAALRVDTPEVRGARPVSARAQLGSMHDAQRRSGGGGLIWAGLGVVVVFGLFGSYKMGLFGGGADQPAPSATAADTATPPASASTPAMSAAPPASMSATATASAAATAMTGTTPSASASAAPSTTASSKAAAATATAAATAAAPHPVRRRPKPVSTVDDTTPDTPAAADTSMSTTPTATATATTTSTPVPTSTATAAPTPAPTSTSTAAPTTTATAKPAATSDSTAAPTATMRRTIGTAAPAATDTP
jgi:uncharacterized protein (TIGR02266 family)